MSINAYNVWQETLKTRDGLHNNIGLNKKKKKRNKSTKTNRLKNFFLNCLWTMPEFAKITLKCWAYSSKKIKKANPIVLEIKSFISDFLKFCFYIIKAWLWIHVLTLIYGTLCCFYLCPFVTDGEALTKFINVYICV